ncbi:MAG: hypothetical protein AAF577_13750 [Pseudomonadota bacterium]
MPSTKVVPDTIRYTACGVTLRRLLSKAMIRKSIEVCYDIAEIPGLGPDDLRGALDFRNAASALIEAAVEEAGIGAWEGTEIGGGRVSFGFQVHDFERAEALVRQTVAGTEFAKIAEIERNVWDDDAADP